MQIKISRSPASVCSLAAGLATLLCEGVGLRCWMVQGDIRTNKICGVEAARRSLRGRPLDILFATPPCQGMSKNGRGKLLQGIRAGHKKRTISNIFCSECPEPFTCGILSPCPNPVNHFPCSPARAVSISVSGRQGFLSPSVFRMRRVFHEQARQHPSSLSG
jgi:hypothetical protein